MCVFERGPLGMRVAGTYKRISISCTVVRESGMCLRRMRERYKKERRRRGGERGGDAEEGTGHATTGRLVARGGDKRANTISPRLLHT